MIFATCILCDLIMKLNDMCGNPMQLDTRHKEEPAERTTKQKFETFTASEEKVEELKKERKKFRRRQEDSI